MKLKSRVLAPTAATALAMIAAEEADPLACIRRALAVCPAQSRAIAIRWMRAPGVLSLEVQEAIAADGLLDRSTLVREYAVEHVEVLALRSLLPRLREIKCESQRGSSMAETVANCIAMLEDGYVAKRVPQLDAWSVWVRTGNGLLGFSVPDQRVQASGMKKAIEEELRLERLGEEADAWLRWLGPPDCA